MEKKNLFNFLYFQTKLASIIIIIIGDCNLFVFTKLYSCAIVWQTDNLHTVLSF